MRWVLRFFLCGHSYQHHVPKHRFPLGLCDPLFYLLLYINELTFSYGKRRKNVHFKIPISYDVGKLRTFFMLLNAQSTKRNGIETAGNLTKITSHPPTNMRTQESRGNRTLYFFFLLPSRKKVCKVLLFRILFFCFFFM